MKNKLAIILAAISVFTFAIPSSAASDVLAPADIISEDTVVVEETATGRKEITTVLYSDGSSAVYTLTVSGDNRGRTTSGTTSATNGAVFSNASGKQFSIQMYAAFSYNGYNNTVECTSQSYVAKEERWSITKEGIKVSAPSGIRKKVSAITSVSAQSPPATGGLTTKVTKTVSISCNSDGKITGNPKI